MIGKSNKLGAVYQPVEPRGDYRITMRFVRVASDEDVGLFLAAPSEAQVFNVDSFKNDGYLHCFLNTLDELEHLPASQRGPLLTNEQEYELVATVINDQGKTTIEIDFDGKRINTWTGQEGTAYQNRFQLPKPNSLGLRLYNSTVEFRKAELEMLSGYVALGMP